jgi:hypothetical protein
MPQASFNNEFTRQKHEEFILPRQLIKKTVAYRGGGEFSVYRPPNNTEALSRKSDNLSASHL